MPLGEESFGHLNSKKSVFETDDFNYVARRVHDDPQTPAPHEKTEDVDDGRMEVPSMASSGLDSAHSA